MALCLYSLNFKITRKQKNWFIFERFFSTSIKNNAELKQVLINQNKLRRPLNV